jgi:hypothetical protein
MRHDTRTYDRTLADPDLWGDGGGDRLQQYRGWTSRSQSDMRPTCGVALDWTREVPGG